MALLLLLFQIASANVLYENTRSFISGLLTGYEGADYVFPTRLCLNTTTQIAINDALIAIAMFAPLNNDAIVEKQIAILDSQIKAFYTGCDLDDFFSGVSETFSAAGFVKLVPRIWWNSILIYKEWYIMKDACQRWEYEACGNGLGVLAYYIFTP
ncbi:unnamed protein product [Blepharisma stoltei]|uniref:Uncharacterized protein n=1 Tax=Blepharisma stoltei TaxID=1481888 RepID=A0AAU9J8Y8_9CILI|nr:unnamed protein product [Blepharisma stoltei]